MNLRILVIGYCVMVELGDALTIGPLGPFLKPVSNGRNPQVYLLLLQTAFKIIWNCSDSYNMVDIDLKFIIQIGILSVL